MRTIFDWLDFKGIADDLSKNSSESNIRASIILYYYAVFSAIREYLIKIKKQYQFINNYKIHERVWRFLLEQGNYNEKDIGEFLSKFRNVRNHANYDKKYGYEYFLEQLKNIQSVIEEITDSIIYLRNSPMEGFKYG